jgi:alpha-1,3/alpha-1,6-mannosyltransferase
VIQAVGFKADKLPELVSDGKKVNVVFDHLSGGFTDMEGNKMRQLFGAGIAFPEKITDPEGNVEMVVGFAKFMNFLTRVVPEWVKS